MPPAFLQDPVLVLNKRRILSFNKHLLSLLSLHESDLLSELDEA